MTFRTYFKEGGGGAGVAELDPRYVNHDEVDDILDPFVEDTDLPSILDDYATELFVTATVAAIVDSSPGALDTLNELAAALGDDPNFSATITNLIAQKAPNTHVGSRDGHPLVTALLDGLMAAADKAKLDTITPANIPSTDQKAGLAGTSGTPGAGNLFVTDGDSRNTDARTPTAHQSSHISGSDQIPAATTALKGLLSADDKLKLDAIESGATNDLTASEILALLNNGNPGTFDMDLLPGSPLAEYDASTPDATTPKSITDAQYTDLHDQIDAAGGVVGVAPMAFVVGDSPALAKTTAMNLAAVGGMAAYPLLVTAPMSVERVMFHNTNAATTRGPVDVAIYQDNPADPENLTRVCLFRAPAWTPVAVSNQIANMIVPASAPVALASGVYWIVLKNRHASSTMALGSTAGGTFSGSTGQTKTDVAGALPSTLDFVTGWTKILTLPGLVAQGRVFGQSVQF